MTASAPVAQALTAHAADSPYAWRRLLINLALVTLGSSAMYVVSVVLPTVQADFGTARAGASWPYMAMMLGFGAGGLVMGRAADRFGLMPVVMFGALSLGVGFVLASLSPNVHVFAIVHAVLLGALGSATTFAPLVADASLWFVRRRGIAVAVCASGNYLAGALWPPIVQWGVAQWGWRPTYVALGVTCAVLMPLLALGLRPKPPAVVAATPSRQGTLPSTRPFGMAQGPALALLSLAGVACCVAMSMPQVHIVALCADLGLGTARGAQMLSLMLACGIVSRLVSGAICDRIGGLRTLLLGSVLQGLALFLFLFADGVVSLFVVSAMFGLFQGGIVPSYAIIVREHFPAARAGMQVSVALTATLLGMALGGWMSGLAYDLTGSYRAAFLNGIAWNALNLSIATWLLWRVSRRGTAA